MTALRNVLQAAAGPLAPRPWQLPAPLRGAWHSLERFGQHRAAAELRVMAQGYALSNPALARQLRAAAAQCETATPQP